MVCEIFAILMTVTAKVTVFLEVTIYIVDDFSNVAEKPTASIFRTAAASSPETMVTN
jgi:hypothetical protein